MKKKLYFTVERGVDWIDQDIAELDGFKTITMYSIENNTPEVIAEINDVEVSTNSTEAIQEYLDDNGMGDDEFEMIQL